MIVVAHDTWIHHLCIQGTQLTFLRVIAVPRCCPLCPRSYLSKHYLLILFVNENKREKPEWKFRIFPPWKLCTAFLFFLSLLLTVTSLERSLRSLGTSNDTQELQDGLWVCFKLLQVSLWTSLFIFCLLYPHPFFCPFFFCSWTLFCQASLVVCFFSFLLVINDGRTCIDCIELCLCWFQMAENGGQITENNGPHWKRVVDVVLFFVGLLLCGFYFFLMSRQSRMLV